MKRPWPALGRSTTRGVGVGGGRMNNLTQKMRMQYASQKECTAQYANVEQCITNNITEWSSPWGTANSSASQQTPHFLRNRIVRYCVYKIQPLDAITVHTPHTHKYCYNPPRSPSRPLSLEFRNQNAVANLFLPHNCHIPYPSWFDHLNDMFWNKNYEARHYTVFSTLLLSPSSSARIFSLPLRTKKTQKCPCDSSEMEQISVVFPYSGCPSYLHFYPEL